MTGTRPRSSSSSNPLLSFYLSLLMCGIIGYTGSGSASKVITDALRRLEYRGYDSVGIAVSDGKTAEIRKDKGMVDEVSASLRFTTMRGNMGIGHTRWATHGAVCKENAHPHTDCAGSVMLVHNGVIENFSALKKDLLAKGHRFASETDSEVLAHLIEEKMKGMPLLKAFLQSVSMIEGSYAVVAMSPADPEGRILMARKNSPLVIGIGRGEMFCA